MEPKKLSKLTLKKEHVSNLSDYNMDRVIGGRTGGFTTIIGNCCSDWTCCTSNYDDTNPYKTNTVNPGSCTCEDRCSIDWNSGQSCAYENCQSAIC